MRAGDQILTRMVLMVGEVSGMVLMTQASGENTQVVFLTTMLRGEALQGKRLRKSLTGILRELSVI